MTKLINWYSGLPPHIKMLLIMAGLGGSTLVFTIKSTVRSVTGLSDMQFYLLAILLLGGIAGLASLVGMGLKRKKRVTEDAVEEEVVSKSQAAPRDMQSATDIRAKNLEFLKFTRDYRKQYRQSVYKAPWYMVIGDSGCGKTRLMNALFSGGDLDLLKGNPEGWQLGTFQYNWWPSQDAIFLDMAGRLVMGDAEDGYGEWLKALAAFKKSRPACPINGVICCISAKHLLAPARGEDAPIEPHLISEQADILRKRLFDLQKQLDVTFATYVVVTQCDRIPGFMELFDRADTDVHTRAQIFGWSRPGDYDETYEPSRFSQDFDDLRVRLHDLVTRRMHDDAPAGELGMAYLFPEQFRQLLPGLQEYVRVLFPRAGTGKARRPLLLRGVYFTSSMQSGSVITRALEQQLGAGIVPFRGLDEVFKGRQKAIFVKHLFMEKVFPEHGLVFPDAERAKKRLGLARWVQAASVLVVVLAGTGMWLGIRAFNKIVGEAGALVDKNADTKAAGLKSDLSDIPMDQPARDEFVPAADKVLTDAATGLKGSTAVRWLGLSVGTVQASLTTLRAYLYEQGIIRPAVRAVEASLSGGFFKDIPPTDHARRARFVEMLSAYINLADDKKAWTSADDLTRELERMLVSRIPSTQPSAANTVLQEQIKLYAAEVAQLTQQNEKSKTPSTSRLLSPRDLAINPADIVHRGVGQYCEFMRPWAEPSATEHPDERMKEWVRLHDNATQSMTEYGKLISLGDTSFDKPEDVNTFIRSVVQRVGSFDHAIGNCVSPAASPIGNTTFAKVVSDTCNIWKMDYATLVTSSGPTSGTAPASRPSLARVVNPLHDTCSRILDGDGPQKQLTNWLLKEKLTDDGKLPETGWTIPVIEISKRHEHIFQESAKATATAPATAMRIELTPDSKVVRARLQELRSRCDQIAGSADSEGDKRDLREWRCAILKACGPFQGVADTRLSESIELEWSGEKHWNKKGLLHILNNGQSRVEEANVLNVLHEAIRAFDAAANRPWGIATLVACNDTKLDTRRSIYDIPIPACERTRLIAPATRQQQPDKARPHLGASKPGKVARVANSGNGTIPIWATWEFMGNGGQDENERFDDYLLPLIDIHAALPDSKWTEKRISDGMRSDVTKSVNELISQLQQAEERHWRNYIDSWTRAYDEAGRKFLRDEILGASRQFDNLRTWSKNNGSEACRQLRGAVYDVLENVTLMDQHWSNPAGMTDQQKKALGQLAVRLGNLRDRYVQLNEYSPAAFRAPQDDPAKCATDASSSLSEFLAAYQAIDLPDVEKGPKARDLSIAWKAATTEAPIAQNMFVVRSRQLRKNAMMALDLEIHNRVRAVEQGKELLDRIKIARSVKAVIGAWDAKVLAEFDGATMRNKWYANAEGWRNLFGIGEDSDNLTKVRIGFQPQTNTGWENLFSKAKLKINDCHVAEIEEGSVKSPENKCDLNPGSLSSATLDFTGRTDYPDLSDVTPTNDLWKQLTSAVGAAAGKTEVTIVLHVDFAAEYKRAKKPDVADKVPTAQGGTFKVELVVKFPHQIPPPPDLKKFEPNWETVPE